MTSASISSPTGAKEDISGTRHGVGVDDMILFCRRRRIDFWRLSWHIRDKIEKDIVRSDSKQNGGIASILLEIVLIDAQRSEAYSLVADRFATLVLKNMKSRLR